MSQEEMDQCWTELAEKMEEEVLDKYKVEDNMRGAYRGRGSSLEWRRMQEVQNMKVERRLLGNNLRHVQKNNLQRLQNIHEDSTEEVEKKEKTERKKKLLLKVADSARFKRA